MALRRPALHDVTNAVPALGAAKPGARAADVALPVGGAAGGARAAVSHRPSGNRDYEQDVLRNLSRDEAAFQVPHDHLKERQVEVTDKMRAILVDWLVDVHLKYKCRPETLYLAVAVLDRYLARQAVEKKKLQLVGCVAMMLACKYEEIMPPEVRQFVHISANTYTKSEMLQMEKTMLQVLGFRLTVPTMWQFLTAANAGEGRELVRHGSEYLAEQTMMCGKMCGFPPSQQAATCVLIARRVLDAEAMWDAEMEEATGYTEGALAESEAVLDEYLRRAPTLRVSAVRKKYSHTRYSCVSRVFDQYGAC